MFNCACILGCGSMLCLLAFSSSPPSPGSHLPPSGSSSSSGPRGANPQSIPPSGHRVGPRPSRTNQDASLEAEGGWSSSLEAEEGQAQL